MNIVENNIVITINVDGIRTVVLNIICPYDIQIVDNESGNFLIAELRIKEKVLP